MALAFDATAFGNDNNTSVTFAHTCMGSNRILFVGIGAELGTGDSITGVTYNGVAMTRVDTLANTNTGQNYRVYLYMLVNPASGANNVVISADEAINIRAESVSYTGAKQTSQPDAQNKATSNTTDQSVAVTVVAANSWIVAVGHAVGVTPTAGTGVTSRNSSANNLRIGDSNGPLSAGSNTVHFTNGSAMDIAAIAASFSPAPDTIGGAFLLNFL